MTTEQELVWTEEELQEAREIAAKVCEEAERIALINSAEDYDEQQR